MAHSINDDLKYSVTVRRTSPSNVEGLGAVSCTNGN
jgi:hypothetical protein